MVITMAEVSPDPTSTTPLTKSDIPPSLNSPLSSTFHTTGSYVSNLGRRTSLASRISQIQANGTTLILSASTPSDFFPGSKSSSVLSTIISADNNSTAPSSTSTPATKQLAPKTGIGLGVGLCVVVVATVIGIVAWGVRKHRRKALGSHKLKISRPISVKTIPMFEVANTDWELPVNRDMPAEMSANRRTGRTWI